MGSQQAGTGLGGDQESHPNGVQRTMGLKGTIELLAALDNQKFRLPADATPAQIMLASKARKMILKVMTKPDRHAQAQLAAARFLLEEACGKVAEQMRIDEHHVTVEVRQNPKPTLPPPVTVTTVLAARKDEDDADQR